DRPPPERLRPPAPPGDPGPARRRSLRPAAGQKPGCHPLDRALHGGDVPAHDPLLLPRPAPGMGHGDHPGCPGRIGPGPDRHAGRRGDGRAAGAVVAGAPDRGAAGDSVPDRGVPGFGIVRSRGKYPSLGAAGKCRRPGPGSDFGSDRPTSGRGLTMTQTRRLQIWLAAGAVAAAVGLVFALRAPVDAFQGEFARIMHIHVPSAWLAFLAFGVTALGSGMWR